MKLNHTAVGLAVILFCSIGCMDFMTVRAADQEPLSPATTFRFGGGEKIRLIVTPESVGTSIEQIVSDDGYIALPTGGEPLNIKNKSRFEAQKLVSERIQKDSGVIKASADIALLSLPARSVYVGGEGVRISQGIQIQGTALTLYAALLAAGGVGPDGDATHVSVSRATAAGTVTTEIYDVSSFGDSNSKSLGPVLEPGDVVKVPRGDVFILAGEVVKPGPLNRRELSSRSEKFARVSSAIYATGGLKSGANRRAVKILRQTKDGSRQILMADLDAAEKSSTSSSFNGAGNLVTQPGSGATGSAAADPDPILQDGDVIIVSSAGGVGVLGKVRVPGIYPINGPSMKLSRVIATAGGFAEFAKTSTVIVIKANNPGGPIHVDMSVLQKGGFQDVELEEGDLVYVPERLL